MAMTTENPNEENIKCVVVGDNNVGKTRLVFSRANKQYEPNHQYLRYGSTHIPTVWANDHYRNDLKVLKKAGDNIDGVNVSLRLWDTFGDHLKNRKFSYGRADVIIVCFSVCDKKSLENVKSFWLPEARRHCKGVPVLIVACKIDLRFANLEDLNKQKTSLAKKIESGHILYPEICRQIAADAGCPYYETSICSGFGVKEVFENAVRAALIYRRKMYLYRNVHLRHIQKPLLQKPLTPPKSDPPKLPKKSEGIPLDFSMLYNDPTYSDVLIVGKNFKFHGHKVILATASKIFHRILSSLVNDIYVISVSNEGKQTLPLDQTSEDQKVPELEPLHSEQINDMCQLPIFEKSPEPRTVADFVLNYSVNRDLKNCTSEVLQFTSDISEFAFTNIMHFCYMGRWLPEITQPEWLKENIQQFSDLFSTCRRFGMECLSDLLTSVLHGESGIFHTLEKIDASRKHEIRNLVLYKTTYSDVEFITDDGTVPGHKALLVCGSDMMSAMFRNDFVESGNKAISFPEATVQSLRTALEYIYTKDATSFGDSTMDYNDVILLANMLCLPELVKIAEMHIIKEFSIQSKMGTTRELHESIVCMLELAQFHNADNLAEWCVYHIITNYNDVCKKCKQIKFLSPDNQKRLEVSRWPPVWFIKDYDAYERACKKRALDENDQRGKNAKKS